MAPLEKNPEDGSSSVAHQPPIPATHPTGTHSTGHSSLTLWPSRQPAAAARGVHPPSQAKKIKEVRKEKKTPTLAKRRMEGKPPPLPEGAWAEWGEDAVYFVSPFKGGQDWEVCLGVYVINPRDSSIYHVVDFTRSTDPELVDASDEASCAVLESRVYVASSEYVWFHEIGGGPEWNKGPKFNGNDMFRARLFTLRGCLYAIHLVKRTCFYRPEHNFQILFKEEDRWSSLDDPPTLCTTQVEAEFLYHHDLLAISCIGHSKVILHVCTKHHVPYLDDKYIFKHHFLCYETKENGYDGKWTRINIDCMDSFYTKQNPRPPPCRSHLLNDCHGLLLFPTSYGKLAALGLLDFHLAPVEVDFDLHGFHDPLIRSSILIQIYPGRYYAITFTQAPKTAISSSQETGVDFFLTTFDLFDRRFLHRFHCRYSGLQLPLPLLSGKAYPYP